MIDDRRAAAGVFVRPRLLTDAMCADVRAAMDRGPAEAAEILGDGYVVDASVRRTLDVGVDVRTIQLVEAAFADVLPDLRAFFGLDLRGTEGPGFLRYQTGGFYRTHRDCVDDPGVERPRRVSLVLFLTDAALAARGASPTAFSRRGIPSGGVARRSNIPDILPPRALPAGRRDGLGATRDFHHGLPGVGEGRCEGGALRIYGVADQARADVPFDITPEAGTLVAFRADLLHEVLPVTRGVRDAVVDWCV